MYDRDRGAFFAEPGLTDVDQLTESGLRPDLWVQQQTDRAEPRGHGRPRFMARFDKGHGRAVGFGDLDHVSFVWRSRRPPETEHGRVAWILGVPGGFQVGHDPGVVHSRGSQLESGTGVVHRRTRAYHPNREVISAR